MRQPIRLPFASCFLCGLLLSDPVSASALFTDVTIASGVSYTHHQLPTHSGIQTYMSGGAAAGDVDGDGWVDLYVTRLDQPDILFRNLGDGTFEDWTTTAFGHSPLSLQSNGAAFGDIDNDGDLDLYVTSLYSQSYQLYINDGTGRFSEEAAARGTDLAGSDQLFGYSPSFGDYDGDGYLDLFTTEWRLTDQNPLSEPQNTRLFRNLGATNPGYFTDVTQSAGVAMDEISASGSSFDSQSFSARFADLDGDGWVDLAVASDHGTSRLFWNNGNGTFTDGTDAAGVGTDQFGMGNAIGDYDGDGDFDWLVTSIYQEDPNDSGQPIAIRNGNRLYQNNGDRSFTDATDTGGVRDGGWGWAATFFDFDHDGDLDLVHTNGTDFPTRGHISAGYEDDQTRLFRNDGGTFVETATALGITDNDTGMGLLTLDYDNDGDLDVFIANNASTPVLYRNETNGAADWLKLRFVGVDSNRQGVGTVVSIIKSPGTTPMLRQQCGGNNFLGQNEPMVHVGLGAPSGSPVHAMIVRWPSGRLQFLTDVARNQELKVTEPPIAEAASLELSAEVLEIGQSFTAELSEARLPPGWTAQWTFEGQTYANPATILTSIEGEIPLKLEIYDDSEFPQRVWSENRRIAVTAFDTENKSVARLWNEQILDAIRIDFPDPTKHARNLFHTSVAMWDAWAAYDNLATGYVHRESATAVDLTAARDEAVSYAAYRVLKARCADSVGATTTLARLDLLMNQLGYDTAITTTEGATPAPLGNRIASEVLEFADWDGWDNTTGFLGADYAPLNDPLPVSELGTILSEPNRWQPLLFEEAITQNGQPAAVIQSFLGANWGAVRPFALVPVDGSDLYLDPGAPPKWGTSSEAEFKQGSLDVIYYSSLLDPAQSAQLNISPGAYGNNTLGLNDGTGRPLNPATGTPYAPNFVLHADFGRVMAEFWADGPDSETPPGHWNKLANDVVDHPEFERRFMGIGDELDSLAWDVRMYFALNGALHDAAVAAWACKRVHDYIRPISSIRYLCSLGQSTNPAGPAYHPGGIPLSDNLVEVVTAESSAPGERHAHLEAHIGKIALYAWAGEVADPENQTGGVGWILGEAWMPYQRSTFVTPAFAGYVSGHSTFSRAAAEVMTRLTGSDFFPGGLASFTAHQNEYLEFENGPSSDVVLQWATYYDAADQAGLSRLYGGIHVPVDDGPGRIMGAQCGIQAWNEALKYFDGTIFDEAVIGKITIRSDASAHVHWNGIRGFHYRVHGSSDLSDFEPLSSWQRAGDLTQEQEVIDNTERAPEQMFFIIERE